MSTLLKNNKNGFSIAIFGASGSVGRHILNVLQEKNISCDHVNLYGSGAHPGASLSLEGGKELVLQNIKIESLPAMDIAFVAMPELAAAKLIKPISERSRLTVDLSRATSLNPKVPLCVGGGETDRKIVATPLPIVTTLYHSLAGLHEVYNLNRLDATVLYSVSAQGRSGMRELMTQTKDNLMSKPSPVEVFHKSIAFNIIPQVGPIMGQGGTTEESALVDQLRKLFKAHVEVHPLIAWVPCFYGCGAFVSVEFEKPLKKDDVLKIWKKNTQLCVDMNSHEIGQFSTFMDVHGEDLIFLSRIQFFVQNPRRLVFWIAFDNVRVAALNAVDVSGCAV